MENKLHKIKRKYTKKVNEHIITYDNYQKYELDLTKYQIGDLKMAIRELGNLRLTGNKSQLIERLTRRFIEIKHSIIIQKIFRGWYLRLIQKLRGPALQNRGICTNGSDMATLEPINEVNLVYFFSYKDINNFIYGFDVSSLIPHIQSKGKFINPYTREIVNKQIAKHAFKVYRGSYALFPEFRKNNKKLDNPPNKRQYTTNSMLTIRRQMNLVRNQFNEAPNRRIFTNIQANLSNIRTQSIDERVRKLFTEIDHLGNYTQHSWFNDLHHRGLILFYRGLFDIWYYRAGLSFTVKRNICFGVGHNAVSPFTRHLNMGYREISLFEYEELKLSCIEVFENMVYCGIDIDHKRLGTLHALSALTLVSSEARNAMPWLYESVA